MNSLKIRSKSLLMLVAGHLVLCLTLLAQAPAAELRLRVTDESGRLIWTRLEVRDVEGKMYQPAGAVVDDTIWPSRIGRAVRAGEQFHPFYRGSFVAHGECRLNVPPGRYKIIAEHGLEYERGERYVEATTAKPAEVHFQLRPWIRMQDRGWYSGDLHVHRPLEQMKALALAEEVNLSAALTIWNQHNQWQDEHPPEDLTIRASEDHLITIMNAEDERGGGAWMLFGLPHPITLEIDGRWYPPGIRFVRQARKLRPDAGLFPWFEVEKPIWWEAPVMMALATPDSIGLLHNHFQQYSVMDNEAWGRPRDQSRYPGHAGFTEYCLQLYYRYLNLGFRVPPTAGSATGVLSNPLGYNRVYVPIEGSFTPEAWFAAVARGRTLVTNGPTLFLDTARESGRAVVSIEALAREPIDRVEVIADGKVIDRRNAEPGGKSLRFHLAVDPARYGWIAVRCFLATTETVRFAHTSPVWLEGEPDCRADAQFFIEWIDELIGQTTPERFSTPAQREEVLALYQKARAVYQEKLAACGSR